ncbi:MAG: rhomboid family intrarane serine protease [Bacillales bacterium]|jgi:membrane associated rhomboid family serine protease|nr:rhomboid family intrarane serine protease [Bacillales bacterium]
MSNGGTQRMPFKNYVKQFPAVSILTITQVFIFTLIILNDDLGRYIFFAMAGVNDLIIDGQIWRTVTPIFLHLNFDHLFYNISLFLFLGVFLEKLLGWKRLIFIYILSGTLANASLIFITEKLFVHFGSSTSNMGLLGFSLIYSKELVTRNSRGLVSAIYVLLLINLLVPFFKSNINIYGHLLGLLFGIIFGILSILEIKKT